MREFVYVCVCQRMRVCVFQIATLSQSKTVFFPAFCCVAAAAVNLTQARVIWEEGSTNEMSACGQVFGASSRSMIDVGGPSA